MNILAEFKALKDKLTGFLADQSKATLASLTEFSTKLTTLETGALAQLEAAQASVKDFTGKLATAGTELGTATTNLSAATGQLTEIKSALTAAASALKLDLKADASPVEMIAAIQGGVSTTLAKLNVPAADIPNAPAKPAASGTMEKAKSTLFGLAKVEEAIASQIADQIKPRN